MNILAEIGVQTWRVKRSLPGAKPEIFANLVQFFKKDTLILSVIYPRCIDNKMGELLNGFWGAIENAGHCSRESHSFASFTTSNSAPFFILGDNVAQMIQKDGLISSEILENAIILDDPQQVLSNPKLKAGWWKAVQAILLHERTTTDENSK